MTDNTHKLIELESLHETGKQRAYEHFTRLCTEALRTLPPSLHGDVPLTVESLGGLFSASSTEVYITVLKDCPDYYPINVEFKFEKTSMMGWKFSEYYISMGMFGSVVIRAKTIEDILVVSRKIASMNKGAATQELMSEEFAKSAVQ